MRFKHLLLATLALGSAAPLGAQTMDPDFARRVAEWTTDPRFSSPWVDHLPLSETVPSPAKFFGDHIGAPKKLHYSAEVLAYFEALAAASPRVKIERIGTSDEGKPDYVVILSSDANIARLDANRAVLAKLADPRGLDPAEALKIAATAKPFYHIFGGLHANETGPAEMMMEMAYRLVTEDSTLIAGIRDQVIVAMTPTVDADGRDRVTDWYFANSVDLTDETKLPPQVPYWSKYLYHNSNRDIMRTSPFAKNHLAYFLKNHATVQHDLHETLPIHYIFSAPSFSENGLDPIVAGEMPWFSNYQKTRLLGFGMPGVGDHGGKDIWWPGFFAFVGPYHNSLMQMSETFSNNGSTTMTRRITPKRAPDGRVLDNGGRDYSTREWFRPVAPPASTLWSLRNNINYLETGTLAALELVANNHELVLANFYRKSLNSVTEGMNKAPYAFVLPEDPMEPTRTAFVINQLLAQGIEVGRATTPVTLSDGQVAAGAFVVKLDQPYGRLARLLLEVQDPNIVKPNKLDDSAWSYGLLFGAKVLPSADKAVLGIATTPVAPYQPVGIVAAKGAPFYLVPDHGAIEMASLRQILAGVRGVTITTATSEAAPAGSLVVPGAAYEMLKPAIEKLGLRATALQAAPAATRAATVPRVAIFSTWGNTQEVGWARYTFDQLGLRYDLVFKEQLQAGKLGARYDVLLIPDQGPGTGKAIYDDVVTSWAKPVPYQRHAKFKTLGAYGSSPDIRGGMGEKGLGALKAFLADGGTIVSMGAGSAFAAEYLVPGGVATTALNGDKQLGPVVQAEPAAASILFQGYPAGAMPVRWATDTRYDLAAVPGAHVLMRFPGGANSVLSGQMPAADKVQGWAAIADLPVGKGQIIFFATDPLHRAQTRSEYRLLFNAMFDHAALREEAGK
jgi:hypothetical protein